MNGNLYDINTVCNMLGTTSRTLRFYEEKQIISSTRTQDSPRRRYSPEQIERIRNVLVLRTLGLSINEIRELRENDASLRDVIEFHKAKIHAVIAEKIKTLNLLNDALYVIESSGDLLKNYDVESTAPMCDRERTARICAEAIVFDDTDTLYGFLSEKMKAYMPKESYEKIRADTLKPLGSFIGFDRVKTDKNAPNVIIHYVRYEKLGLSIKLVFHGDLIHGLWLNYYEK